MMKKLRSHYLVASVLIGMTISGCATFPSAPPEAVENDASPERAGQFNNLVSRDVVSILAQINELSPTNTTLGVSNDGWQAGDFANALRRELESAGYAIRSAGAGQGTISIGYTVSDSTLDIPADRQGQAQTVTVFAGDIAVRRSYLISGEGAISPLGNMQVRGADASMLNLQRDIFDERAKDNDELDTKPDMPKSTANSAEQIAQSTPPAAATQSAPPAAVTEAPASNPEIVAPQQTDEQLMQATPEVASTPERSTFLDLVAPSVPVTEPSGQTILAIKPDRDTQNVMELQQSNFEDLFADMAFVSEKVLTFANDSTVMGGVNKVRLQELVDNFEADSDMFSLVGCSLGQTNYAGGQEGLARGRAMRVREELLYAGIPEDNIVEEGCWAEEAFDLRMPRRGVVVTLKRRTG